jgi:hypothetical protein
VLQSNEFIWKKDEGFFLSEPEMTNPQTWMCLLNRQVILTVLRTQHSPEEENSNNTEEDEETSSISTASEQDGLLGTT